MRERSDINAVAAIRLRENRCTKCAHAAKDRGCFFCSAEQVVPFGLSLRHPTRVYEDLRRNYWENRQEGEAMNDDAFNDKCYVWKDNRYRIYNVHGV
jgi:hypothetical protein